MSLNTFDPPTDNTFEYVMNFQPTDFMSYGMITDASCNVIKKMATKPCDYAEDSEECYNQTLCENKDLAKQTMLISSINQQAQNRQKDSSTMFDNSVQTCVSLCIGIVAMVIVAIKAL
jgi:hypothetical protein